MFPQLSSIAALLTQAGARGKSTSHALTPNADNTGFQWTLFSVPALPGQGGQVITGNVTITVTGGVPSNAAISVTPATPGLYVTLPDATTISAEGVVQISVYNAGDYDYGVKDSAGTQLGWVRPRTGAIIGLADNSTAAGTWAYYGLEKIGITAQYSNPSAANVGSGIRYVSLDSDRVCILFGGTTCYAVILDKSTGTWGTAVAVKTGMSLAGGFAGVKSATDQILVCTNTTTELWMGTLTISGTTITVNALVMTSLAGAIAEIGSLIAVGSSFVISYGRATTGAIRATTISGTVPTTGAESTTTPATAVAPNIYASGSIVRTVACSASSLECKPFTVSGSTLSAGTAATASISHAIYRSFVDANGDIICNYLNSNHSAAIFRLTTTVEAVSTAVLSATAPSASLTATDYVQISATKTLFMSYETLNWYANILTNTSGTASVGTQATGAASSNFSSVCGIAAEGSTGRFVLTSTTMRFPFAIDCSGASPSISRIDKYTHTGTPATAGAITASDKYGVRYLYNLIAGKVVYPFIGNNSGFYASVIGGQQLVKSNVSVVAAVASAYATNSESFYFTYLDGGSTGAIIQRIEAAA